MPRAIVALVALGMTAWAGPAAAGEAEAEALPALELVDRYTVPERQGGTVVDLRWAGNDSIYLTDVQTGITEHRLEEGLPEVRRVTPAVGKIGLPLLRHSAVSDDWVVTSHLGKLAWTSGDNDGLAGEWKVRDKIGSFHDFDIRGEDLILLGVPDGESYRRSRGGVVWRGDLSKGLARWQVLYEREEFAEDPDLLRLEAALGSLALLPGGGFAIAPNFVPGVMEFSSSGRLKESWSPEDLWGEVEETRGRVDPEDLPRFLASHRVIDEILPLPDGPAILVREPRDDDARYRLAVLGTEIRWYDVPIGRIDNGARLRGDADEKGRIVLVGTGRSPTDRERISINEVLVLTLPE